MHEAGCVGAYWARFLSFLYQYIISRLYTKAVSKWLYRLSWQLTGRNSAGTQACSRTAPVQPWSCKLF